MILSKWINENGKQYYENQKSEECTNNSNMHQKKLKNYLLLIS